MELIDAHWDTRSLGVRCAEILFDANDTEADAEEAVSQRDGYSYVVAKVPVGSLHLSLSLQGSGFRHIETSIEMVADLRSPSLPPMVARFAPHVRSLRATPDSEHTVFEHVAAGLFKTDRVYLDPYFSRRQAATRYENWIRDEMRRGSGLFHVFYKDIEVGFFALKQDDGGTEAYPFLAGAYDDVGVRGLGTNVVCQAPMDEARRLGCSRMRTHVSSNNPPVLRAHESVGYLVAGMHDVLAWHREWGTNG